jgi:hypothetical protein
MKIAKARLRGRGVKSMKALTYFMLAAAALACGMGATAFAQDDTPTRSSVTSVTPALPAGTVARYLVTYMKSNTATTALRTATIISVTNQSSSTCRVAVDWKVGGTSTVCTTTLSLSPRSELDFCSRTIPDGITTCNATCSPSLTFKEGKAVVGSSTTTGCEKIALSARTVYTSSTSDSPVNGITDAKIVKFGAGNIGD